MMFIVALIEVITISGFSFSAWPGIRHSASAIMSLNANPVASVDFGVAAAFTSRANFDDYFASRVGSRRPLEMLGLLQIPHRFL